MNCRGLASKPSTNMLIYKFPERSVMPNCIPYPPKPNVNLQYKSNVMPNCIPYPPKPNVILQYKSNIMPNCIS